VIFGGVGSGLYGMIMFAIIAVFIAGLMIGRTPNISARRSVHSSQDGVDRDPDSTAAGALRDRDRRHARPAKRVANPAEHGFSEISTPSRRPETTTASAFAGLSANTPFYNTALGIVMLFARYWLAIRYWHSPARSPPRSSCRPRRGRCRPTRRCSWSC
jgi:K+-transporting ATPase ATPase A chain